MDEQLETIRENAEYAGSLYLLIERLLAATEHDRKLDTAILQATDPNGYRIDDDGTILVSGDMGDGPGWFNIGYDVPEFTASIDAAITLVPHPSMWSVANYVPESGDAFVHLANGGVKSASAKTPAIALCIAALRARAALIADHRAEGK